MYSIGQVARLLNVHSQTLRNWERQGLISPKRFGQSRVYSKSDIKQCKKVKRYSGRGIQLQSIKEAINNYDQKSQGGKAA